MGIVKCLKKNSSYQLSDQCFSNTGIPVFRALYNFSTEEYVTSSVLGQGVFDAPSLTLVIGANIFLTNFKYF
jgi:hypothetical protein